MHLYVDIVRFIWYYNLTELDIGHKGGQINTGRKRNKRLYNIWSCMKQRCLNPNHTAAAWYHDKGIRVCDEWMVYENFETWAMQNGYEPNLSIDRIDPDKNYTPDNCRWITLAENRARHGTRMSQRSNIKKKRGKFMVVKKCGPMNYALAEVIVSGLSKHDALFMENELNKKHTPKRPYDRNPYYMRVSDGHEPGDYVEWNKLRMYLTQPRLEQNK